MIEQNVSLKPFNTFGIDVKAATFATFDSVEQLSDGIDQNSGRPLLVLGGGSNILFTKDFEGLVLRNAIPGIDIVDDVGNEIFVKAGAGVNWHAFVMYCVENNLGGIENLSLIPGNVGASPMQNIGAYGVEIKDVFHELEAFDLRSGERHFFNNQQCEFGYRDSVFKKKFRGEYIILSVTYKLSRNYEPNVSYGALKEELTRRNISTPSIRQVSDAVIHIRQSKLPDPTQIGNAGSFFKNPVVTLTHFESLKQANPGIPSFPTDNGVKIPAAWLIEQCGWKGYRNGDAGCHAKQPLVLVNYGNATGAQIYALSRQILESVEQKFNVSLETEVNII